MKIEVQEKHLKTGNREMSLSNFQGVVMIRLASVNLQELMQLLVWNEDG